MKTLTFIAVFIICVQVSFAQKVKGRVVDDLYFPVPDVEVQIEGGSSTTTDKNGEFTIAAQNSPYNITLNYKPQLLAVRYEGLTTNEPELRLFRHIPDISKREQLNVKFPAIPGNSTGIVQFLSRDIFFSKSRQVKGGSSSASISVEWSSAKESIQGYVILIQKTGDEYTGYIEYPVTIKRNQHFPQAIIIPEHFSMRNTGTSIITLNPIVDDSWNTGFRVYGDFPELGFNSNIEFPSKRGKGGVVTAFVPTSLPFEYRLKVKIDVSKIKGGESFTDYRYFTPNTSTVDAKQINIPKIISPLNKVTQSDSSTVFSYGKDFGFGVYVVWFTTFPSPFSPSTPPAPPSPPTYSAFYIVTASRTLKNPLEDSYGILKGNSLSWYVSNYSDFRDVNDFVKPMKDRNNYKESSTSTSEGRTLEIKN